VEADVRSDAVRYRTPVQEISLLVGLGFLAAGIAGFIPGLTTHYSDLSFAGHGSGAKLFGVFQVSVLHNLVHLLFGVAGVVLSRTRDTARAFLVGGGLVYLVLFLYGLLISQHSGANFVPVNDADNVLHAALCCPTRSAPARPRRSAACSPPRRSSPPRSELRTGRCGSSRSRFCSR
jgi:hypothetical protein